MDGWWTLAAGDIELSGPSGTRRDGYQGIASPPIVDPEAIVQLPFFLSRL
jgi:hypothetical protein